MGETGGAPSVSAGSPMIIAALSAGPAARLPQPTGGDLVLRPVQAGHLKVVLDTHLVQVQWVVHGPSSKSLETEFLDVKRLYQRSLDVKRFALEIFGPESYARSMAETDSVDFCTVDITSHYDEIHPEVEGVVSRIAAISKQVGRSFDETVAAYGLSHSEYRMLLRLATRSEDKRMSAGELSRALMLSSGAMTNRLDRLEKAGLLRRVPDPRDRRGVLVELTAEGVKTIDRAVIEQAAKEIDVMSTLSPKELTQLNNLLRKVLISLERSSADKDAEAV